MKLCRKNLFIPVIAITVFLFSFCNLQAGKSGGKNEVNKIIKILTIGNSFADNACTYLSQITKSVPGCSIEYTKANIGGCFLEKHANLIKECENDASLKPYAKKFTLKELLLKDKYDIVTIQQVSHLSYKSESFQPYADILCAFIKEHVPQAEIMVHQTWAYSPTCKRLKEFGITREEMHKRLVVNYNNLAERYGSDILPSGSSFNNSFTKNSDVDLWNAKDRFHANMNGCYLAGCVWFGKFFGVSPRKIDFVPEGMNPKTARYLKKIAAKTINEQ